MFVIPSASRIKHEQNTRRGIEEMAQPDPDSKKRKRTLKPIRPQKSRKQQKTLGASTGGRSTADTLPRANPAPARKVRLGNLTWKKVEIPDVLDDYEGFYGLEEVDDVEVVREGNIISYKAKEERPDESAEGWGIRETDVFKGENGEIVEEEQDGQDLDEEEWAGFSDEENDPLPAQDSKIQNDKSKSKAKQNSEKIKKPTSSVPEAKAPAVISAEPIHSTAEEEEEDESEGLGNADEDGTDRNMDSDLDDTGFAALQAEQLPASQSKAKDSKAWLSLPINPEIRAALNALNFKEPTPIQKAVIPEIVNGLDVVGKAATGSGKTLAYGIPLLDAFLNTEVEGTDDISEKKEHIPLALIIAPTRELAHQINTHLTALHTQLEGKRPRLVTVTGGLAVQKQQRQLAKADYVIATPGRLWDVVSSSTGLMTRLKQIRFIVIDEADRLLSEGHFKEVDEILTALNRKVEDEEADEDADKVDSADQRQTLVFSATFSKDLQQRLSSTKRRQIASSKTSGDMSTDESLSYLLAKLPFRAGQTPKFIDVNPISAMAPNLREGLIECPGAMDKDLYLYALLLLHPRTRTLVFANSISAVRRLVPYLQHLGLPAQALHSNMQQKARLKAVERFASDAFKAPTNPSLNGSVSKNDTGILVCTDIAARGLDISNVDLVVHYHLPRTADTYVHRSGRTARAGAKGGSILICAPSEVLNMRRLVARVHVERSGGTKRALRSVELDHRVVTKLRERANLAKRIADVESARAMKGAGKGKEAPAEDDEETEAKKPNGNSNARTSHKNILRQAALDLGVEYSTDSDDPTTKIKARGVRGNARREKTKANAEVSKAEIASWKRELKELISKRVNVGVSERYITSGTVDIEGLLKGEGLWLGDVKGVDMDLEGL